MAFIRKGNADIPEICLYATCPVPDALLDLIKRDFNLAAHLDYAPAVRLSVSERKDLYSCKNPEAVLALLEREGVVQDARFSPFLLVDAACVQAYDDDPSLEPALVWFVSGWAQADTVPERLAEQYGEGRTSWPLPFAMKLLLRAYYAPILHVNLKLANTSIPEKWPPYYSPFKDRTLYDDGVDWRCRAPPPAYVVADESCYTVSTAAASGNRTIRLGGSQREADTMRTYSLKSDVAERLRLKPSYRLATLEEWKPLNTDEDALATEAGLDRDTAVVFPQDWD